jgi:urea transport system permease protein
VGISSRILGLAIAALIACVTVFSYAQTADAADDAVFAAQVKALDVRSFNDRATAMRTLAESDHPRVRVVLQALSDGLLFRRKSDDLMVIGEGGGGDYALSDAATGSSEGRAASSELSKIIANNTMRVEIRSLLGALALMSPDLAQRQQAARGLLSNPDPAAIPGLEKALAREHDDGVRADLSLALSAARALGGDVAQRLKAVEALGKETSSDARSILSQVAQSDVEASVRQRAESALKSVEGRLEAMGWLQNLLFGLSLGSILLLAAIGLAITFGVMGVINMAHGEMMMLGAYTAFVVQEVFRSVMPDSMFGLYLLVALPAAFLVSGGMGVLIERTIIRWLYGRPLETLLATWGVSLALQQLVRSIFGATNREVANPDWMSGSLALMPGLDLTMNRGVIIVFGFVVLAGLAAYLRYSRMGLNMRAVTQNRRMASAMGIRTAWVDAMTFGLGSGIAGVAGVALSQVTNVSPNLGQGYIVDSFMVVVFGGVGSLWGTLLGAMSLGVVNKLLEPFAGAMLGKILMLVLIILFIQKRPRGLFALKGRSID